MPDFIYDLPQSPVFCLQIRYFPLTVMEIQFKLLLLPYRIKKRAALHSLIGIWRTAPDEQSMPNHLSFKSERVKARIERALSKLLLNAQKLIVLRDTLGTARCAGLDLAGVQRNRKIRDRRILRLAGTV